MLFSSFLLLFLIQLHLLNVIISKITLQVAQRVAFQQLASMLFLRKVTLQKWLLIHCILQTLGILLNKILALFELYTNFINIVEETRKRYVSLIIHFEGSEFQ